MKLEEIIESFEEFRDNFRQFRRTGHITKDALIEYEARVVDLRADLRPHRSSLLAKVAKRDDKASTAFKYRIATKINEGVFTDSSDKEGERGKEYSKCSINQAEKYAAGTNMYINFIKDRSLYKSGYLNVSSLHSDMDGYINLIKDMLKFQ